MPNAYYNENDPFAAAWLRELIKHNLIAQGDVDERSIAEVRPRDLDGYAQCHFFAGIGGWSYALRLAGWPDDRPVWTGSCPCQPFSAAGKGEGFADPRHLWPKWFRLVQFRRPVTVFGEQVDKALGWLDLVSGNMESEGYAVGSAIVGAHSVGAPHIRQRLYFVANNNNTGLPERISIGRVQREEVGSPAGQTTKLRSYLSVPQDRLCGLADSTQQQHGCRNSGSSRRSESSNSGSVEHAPSEQMGLPRCTWFDGNPADWIPCIDGKARPVEPGTFPLAHGATNRVGRLRGYGNAIVPQVAAEFIMSYMEITA